MNPAKRPQLLACYLCGQQFGTASLPIHMPQCYDKKMKEWKNADPNTRGPKPRNPDTFDISQMPTDVRNVEEVEEFNNRQFGKFTDNMSQCPNCGRKFLPDRLEVHLRSCKGGGQGSKPVAGKGPPSRGGGSRGGDGGGGPSGPAKRPMLLICYLCGQQFGTSSLTIHMPQCYEKKMIEWKNADPEKRGPRPKHPDTVDLSNIPKDLSNDDEVQQFNEQVFGNYKNNMAQCQNCGRRFLADRLEVHLRSCKPGQGSRPVNGARPTTSSGPDAPPPARSQSRGRDGGSSGPQYQNNEDVDDTKQDLAACNLCGRTFLPDRLEVHKRSCKGGSKPNVNRRPQTSSGNDGDGVERPRSRAGVSDVPERKVSASLDTGKHAKPMSAQARVLRQLSFEDVDVNGDGMIDTVELKTVLKDIGFQASDEELQTFMGLYDADEDGKINLADWESANFGEKILEFTGMSPRAMPFKPSKDPKILRKSVELAGMVSRKCSECDMVEYDGGAKFCQECGTPLPALEATGNAPHSAPLTCTSCGEHLNADQKFCSTCGMKVVRPGSPGAKAPPPPPPPGTCANCGNHNSPEAKFCEECGNTMNTSSAPHSKAQPSQPSSGGGGGGGGGSKWNRNPLVNRLPEVSQATVRPTHKDEPPDEDPDDYNSPEQGHYRDDFPDDEPPQEDRVTCSNCGRKFNTDRIQQHEQVCFNIKKRPTFNAAKHRVQGTEMEKCQKTKIVAKKETNWKEQSQMLREAMKTSRQISATLAKGGDLKNLPPPTYSENKHYVQCKYCNRRFAPDVAERHIPACANTMNKPKPPPKRR